MSLPFVERDLVAGEERIDEGAVLLARQRAVDVVGASAAGAFLVVARLEPGDVKIDGVAMHDRRDRVEERERVGAGAPPYRFRQRRRRERPGSDDDAVPIRGRQGGDLLARDRHQRLRLQRRGDRGGKAVAVDRERADRRHLMRIGGTHHQRAEAPHLLVQQADRVVLVIVGAGEFSTPARRDGSVLCTAVARTGRI